MSYERTDAVAMLLLALICALIASECGAFSTFVPVEIVRMSDSGSVDDGVGGPIYRIDALRLDTDPPKPQSFKIDSYTRRKLAGHGMPLTRFNPGERFQLELWSDPFDMEPLKIIRRFKKLE